MESLQLALASSRVDGGADLILVSLDAVAEFGA